MAPSSTTQPPALQESIHTSTTTWQANLQSLFELAKDRFPDVVWELMAHEDDMGKEVEEVWGHKGKPYRSTDLINLIVNVFQLLYMHEPRPVSKLVTSRSVQPPSAHPRPPNSHPRMVP